MDARKLRESQLAVTVVLALAVGAIFWATMTLPKNAALEVLYALPLFLAGAHLPRRSAVAVGLVGLGLCTYMTVEMWPLTIIDGVGLVALVGAGWWAVRTGMQSARLRKVTVEAEQLYGESERQRQELAFQTLPDDLTGLPNRVLLHDRLQQAILAARRKTGSLALLLLDLDRFKDLNDTLGHDYGDALLRQIGPCIQRALRESDTVARLGGDEFAVLLPDAGRPDDARLTTRKILKAFDAAFEVDGQLVDVGGSIGIALYPDHGLDAQTLLRHADVAMYVAKRAHDGFAFYAPQEDANTADRLVLTGELRQAIEHDQLVLHYQPKVALAGFGTPRAEALVRWQHPNRGLVPPDSFIPLAEQTGLIRPLSRWLLDEVLSQSQSWRANGLDVTVAVNLSMRDLHDPSVPLLIKDLLLGHQMPPSALTVEITESVIMADPARALQVITDLSEMGLSLSIDDFGTGYSSLAYLKRLPVNELKIDKSFVQDMHRDDNDAVIVRSIIDLAHNLGLRVVAEGVETQETWEVLASMGCDDGQGFYIARPMAAGDFEGWLRRVAPASGRAALQVAI